VAGEREREGASLAGQDAAGHQLPAGLYLLKAYFKGHVVTMKLQKA
jgi:hypothetical protein